MTEVRLTKASTFEFDPDKSYLVQVKEGTISPDDTQKLNKTFEKWGIKNVVFVFLPKGKSLKIMEVKK